MKKVKNSDYAWEVQHTFKGEPHGWIQWKGTDVCMDVHCECGKLTHVDGMFCYSVKCSNCGRIYFCNGHIEFIQLDEEPNQCLQTDKNDWSD